MAKTTKPTTPESVREKARTWIRDKGWDQRSFTINETEFDCKVIGAFEEWELLEDVRMILGLGLATNQVNLRGLIDKVGAEADIASTLFQVLTSIPRQVVKDYSAKLFKHVWYKHKNSDGWNNLADMRDEGMMHLRGGDVYTLIARVFVANFHDSFSLIG